MIKKAFSGMILSLIAIFFLTAMALADDPAFQVSMTEAAPGEEATLTVSTVNNPGIVSFELNIEYDEEVLDWVGVEQGTYDGIWDLRTGESCLWFDADDHTDDAVILTLTFRVSDDSPVGFSEVTVSYEDEDVFNVNEEDISFAVIPGGIEVVEVSNSNAVSEQVGDSIPTTTNNSTNSTFSNPGMNAILAVCIVIICLLVVTIIIILKKRPPHKES